MTLVREMAGEIEAQGLMWVPPLLVPYKLGGILDIRQMAQTDTYKGQIVGLTMVIPDGTEFYCCYYQL